MARAGEEIYLASPPVPVQKPVLATLAPVGRLLGYKDHYRKYSAADDPGGAEPPSTTSVMVRAVVLVASLVVLSSFLAGRAWRLSKRAKHAIKGEGLEERGEVCLAEEVEHLRQLGLSDEEVATKLGVDVSWVKTLVSPGQEEPGPESKG